MITASIRSPIRNVSLGPADVVGGPFSPYIAADYTNVVVGQACRGKYHLGLNDHSDGVLRAYRYFEVETVDECIAEGADVDKDNPWCWDSWRVVVKDSNGTVVATSDE
jgi:hypothetical protein